MKRYQLLLWLALLLTSCGVGTPPPQAALSDAQAMPAPAASMVPAATISTTATPSSALAWQELSVVVPPQHVWQEGPFPMAEQIAAPVLAQGQIAFDATQAQRTTVEQPGGMIFSIVRFGGDSEAWLKQEQQGVHPANPIDPATIRQITIAARPALVYSYMVTGVSRSETSFVPLNDERALLIHNSDADNPAYRAVVDALVIK